MSDADLRSEPSEHGSSLKRALRIISEKSIGPGLKLMWSATVASWVNMFVQLVGTIVIVPLIWNRWGSLELGAYLLILSVNRFALLISDRLALSFSTLFAFVAAGSASIRPRTNIFDPHAASAGGDESNSTDLEQSRFQFRAIFETLGSILLMISVVSVSITSCVAIPALYRLGESYGGLETTCLYAMLVALVTLVVRINLLRYEILLRGFDHVAQLGRWNAAFNLFGLAAIVICVLVGGKLVHCSLILLATTVLTGLRNWLLAHSHPEQFDLTTPRIFGWDKEVIDAVWAPTVQGLIGSIAYVGGDELVAMLSPFFLEGREATQFLLYNRCLNVIGPIAQIPMTARLPLLARLIAAGDAKALAVFMRRRILFCGLLVLLGANFVGLVVPVINRLSGKDGIVIPLTIWSVVVFLYTAERLNGLFNIVLESGNLIVFHWRRAFVTLVCLAVLPLCLHTWGIAGGFFAILLPRTLLFYNLLVTEVSRFSSVKSSELVQKSYAPLLAAQFGICCLIAGLAAAGFRYESIIDNLEYRRLLSLAW